MRQDSLQNVRTVSNSYSLSKRLIDILGSLFLIILTLPIYIVIGLFYMNGENKGPIFFKQVRIGKNGNKFRIYKFRSMVVNAEEKLKSDEILYQKYLDNSYKLEPEEDPRITRVGRFLRASSIDEIPQLINVLKGEMSLVGPRPIVEEELVEYGERTSEFLSVKPGITGYWQVSGRSDIDYPERVDVELYYVNKASFLFDIKILLKTVSIVLLRKGAY
mgnify:CR=1 FL=1